MFALVAALSAQVPLSAPCPRVPAAAALDSAWQAYRRGAVAAAARLFATADSLCPRAPGAQTGLGFVALRQSRLADAEQRFARALAADSSDADAWYGLGLARLRRGRLQSWRSAARCAAPPTIAMPRTNCSGLASTPACLSPRSPFRLSCGCRLARRESAS